jgi:enterochelin esterase family protein
MTRAAEVTISPRIAALRAALDRGESGVEARFWEHAAREGTPLVEPIEGDAEHVLVTFLWRGNAETKAVVVLGGISGFRMPELERIEGSDVWFATYRSPVCVRTTYRLLENPSWFGRDIMTLTSEEFVATQSEGWCADPLNPLRFERPMMPLASIVELAGAVEQPWIVERAEVAKGRIEPHRWDSQSLQSARIVWTYLPPGYDESDTTYPLIVLFDGYNYLQMEIQHTLDNLIAAGRIPPVVCALVHWIDRWVELACNEQFTDAVADELIAKWLPERYRTGGPAIVGGMSLGGLAAAFCALRRPDAFGAGVISQSGSYWWGAGAPALQRMSDRSVHWEWLIDEYERSTAPPLRWHMDVGVLEIANPETDGPDMIKVNRRMRDVLRANRHDVSYEEFAGGHDFVCWRGTLADALQTLLKR